MPRKGEEKIFIVCNVWKYQVWQWQDHWHGLTRAKQNLILSQIPKEKKQKLAIKKPLLRPSNAAEELYNFFFAICHDVFKIQVKMSITEDVLFQDCWTFIGQMVKRGKRADEKIRRFLYIKKQKENCQKYPENIPVKSEIMIQRW